MQKLQVKNKAPGVELISWTVFQRMTLHLSFKDCEPHHYQSGQKEAFCHAAHPGEGFLLIAVSSLKLPNMLESYLDSLMELFAFFNAFPPHLLYFHVPGISIKDQTDCKLDKCVMS